MPISTCTLFPGNLTLSLLLLLRFMSKIFVLISATVDIITIDKSFKLLSLSCGCRLCVSDL